ncbi:TonB-dependent receptor [Novosphingobium sp.]|uniref:TonB-dependent receptor n=1 Tax=Novosphingobium sp. TaxID=1874826 RepID=UPI00286DDBB4|nr:TonB-dependent receptor [Novosphingobium sp.]
MKAFRFKLVASVISLSIAAAAAPAFAQAADEIDGPDDGEIVVTAQRRSEKSVDVPITITAINASQLETANVQNLADISKLTPALRFDNAGGWFQPTIRGVGTPVATSGGGANVGIYVDNFYSPNPLAANFQLMKVQGVEVLKGPQGTLFGHNTTGGAILVRTADPSTETGGQIKASYGRFDEFKSQAYFTTGLTESVAFDVEGMYSRGDGWLTNVVNGVRQGHYENWSVRTGLKINFSDSASLLLRYQHAETDDPTPALTATYRDPVFGSGAPWFAAPADVTFDPDKIASRHKQHIRSNTDIFQATLKADLGFADMASYTQYRTEKSDMSLTLSYNGTGIFEIGLPIENKTWSQEVLFTSKPGTALQWTAGVFAFGNKDTWQVLSDNAQPTRVRIGGSGTNTKTLAAFVDMTYEISPQLFLTAGGRFSHDSVTGAYFNTFNLPPFDPTFKQPLGDISSNHFTPRVVLRYKPNSTSSIYASFTQGYKSAIIDAGGSCQNAPAYKCNDVAPEKINAFELGYKYSDRGVTVDLSAYYYDYKNLQVSAYLAGRANILNAANSEIYGLDGQVSFRVSDSFTLNAGAAYTHARYKQFNNAPVYTPCSAFPAGSGANCLDAAVLNNGITFLVIPTTLKNVTMQRTPEFTATVGARYSTQVADGKLDLSGNLYYSSKFFFGPSGIQFPQEGYATLALRAAWTDPSDHLTFAVYGENVTNKRYLTQVQYSNFGIGANWSKPASYGVEVGVKF